MTEDLLLLSIEVHKHREHGYTYYNSSHHLGFRKRWEPDPQAVFFLVAADTLSTLGMADIGDTLSKLIDEFIDKLSKTFGGKDND